MEAISEEATLISVDELRGAGALDVPAAWRKSLGVEQKLLLFDVDDTRSEKQPAPSDAEDDESDDDDLSGDERE